MTTTCLPTEAYYHINRNTKPPERPRFKEPEDPNIRFLLNVMGIRVATTHEWEAAYRLCFNNDDPLFWADPPEHWTGSAEKFRQAFILADSFVGDVMHRLFPFQQKEILCALCYALYSHAERRETSVPRTITEAQALTLLEWANFEHMAEWLEEQQ